MHFLDALQRMVQSLGYRGNVSDFMVLYGLALGRVATAISLAPFFGGQAVGSNIKLGLSVMVTALLMPALSRGQAAPGDPMLVVALFAKEVMIGVTIGFIAQLILYAVQTAGALIDVQRGMDQPGLHAPQLAGNVSAMGLFQFQLALVILLFLNGHLIYIRALADSFARIPLLGFPRLAAPASVAQLVGQVSGQIFVVALQLGAPVLLTLLLMDVIFGVINKIASQVNIHNESLPVKAFVGLVILVPSIAFIFSRAGELLSQMIWNIYSVLARLA
jgi:flagellar biosynthetic protein FliR